MATRTIIRQCKTDLPFSMELVYYPVTAKYAVIFASMSLRGGREESRTYNSFGEAWDVFDKNWYYYKGTHPAPITEEEFQGLSLGTLYPRKEAC